MDALHLTKLKYRMFQKELYNLKACINLFRGHAQCFELSYCSRIRRVLPEIVTVQRDISLVMKGVSNVTCVASFFQNVFTYRHTKYSSFKVLNDSLYAFKCERIRNTRHTTILKLLLKHSV
jgi:hypothetical protein